ncbi:MAG TPA: hypothetical protein PKB09_03695 [Candidatus Saccharibacteria bacterium]|nr:hypothetical protein [Candidatus Saccharibacteria bacterium]
MDNQKQSLLSKSTPWLLFFIVVVIGCTAYFSDQNWEISAVVSSGLSIFPLLGIVAWSIMWTHFVYGALRIKYRLPKNKLYSVSSGWLVLILILLHPGLFFFEMNRTTQLLPPKSILLYTGEGLLWAVLIAELALLIFLSYEVFNRIRDKAIIKKNWFWISLSQMLAMTLIFVHSLALGQNLKDGWFRYYWILLFVILAVCFAIIFKTELKKRQTQSLPEPPQQTPPVSNPPQNSVIQ